MKKSEMHAISAHLLAHSMGLAMPEYDQATQERKARQDPLYGLDLHAEYDLIKMKKSNLSRAQRARVVNIVESGPHKILDTKWPEQNE